MKEKTLRASKVKKETEKKGKKNTWRTLEGAFFNSKGKIQRGKASS